MHNNQTMKISQTQVKNMTLISEIKTSWATSTLHSLQRQFSGHHALIEFLIREILETIWHQSLEELMPHILVPKQNDGLGSIRNWIYT